MEVINVMTDKEKRMIEEIDDYLFEKYCIEGDTKIEEIIRFFSDDCRDCSRRKWYQKGYDDGIRKYKKSETVDSSV